MCTNPAPLRTVGVVPASGASRRMGFPKALLEFEGRTFVQRTVDALRDGGCSDVLVVVSGNDAAVASAARATGARVLENEDPGEGPITSMRLALEAIDERVEAIAWLPVDVPLVDGRIVRALRDRAAAGAEALVLPIHAGPSNTSTRGHPPIFKRSLFPELLDPELEGGARTVVHRHLHAAALVPFDDAAVATDIDTRPEYRSLTGIEPPSDESASPDSGPSRP